MAGGSAQVEPDPEKLKKNRQYIRGWCTRLSNQLQSLLEGDESTTSSFIVKLSDAVEHLQIELNKLEDVDGQIIPLLPDDEMEDELDAAATFRSDIRAPLVLALQKIHEIEQERQSQVGQTQAQAPSSASVHESESSRRLAVKLPKLELPHFDGKYTEWTTFWEHFRTHVDENADVPTISKFTYLCSLLDGEPKEVIRGYAITEANYETALSDLVDRYGRSGKIVFAHVQALLMLKQKPILKGPKFVESLWQLQTEISSHVRSLENLGVTGDQCEIFLTPIILQQLPQDIRLLWAREAAASEDKERDLAFLMKFLKQEIETIERSETYKEDKTTAPTQQKYVPKKYEPYKSSTAGLLATNNTGCNFCHRKNHLSEQCHQVVNLSDKMKVQRIKDADLCFKCLMKNHKSLSCPNINQVFCKKCKSTRHNSLMCGVRWDIIAPRPKPVMEPSAVPAATGGTGVTSTPNPSSAAESTHTTAAAPHAMNLHTTPKNRGTLLQTANVPAVVDGKRTVMGKILFDSGAEVPYVTSKFVKNINAQWLDRRFLPYSNFGGGIDAAWRNIYKVPLVCKDGSTVTLEAAEIPVICASMRRPPVPAEVLHTFSHLELADNDVSSESDLQIDVVIGLGDYWNLITVEDALQYNGMVALKSAFGYILSGTYSNSYPHLLCPSYSIVKPQLLCPQLPVHLQAMSAGAAVEKLWNLEALGVTDRPTSTTLDEQLAMEEFMKSVSVDPNTGRYEVGLPFKDEECRKLLKNNQKLVKELHMRMSKKLDKNPEIKAKYADVFTEYEKDEIIEEVPVNEINKINEVQYIPDRPVINERNKSSPVRPVFNMSFGGYEKLSLNDTLLTGPSLNPEIPEVIMRFRTHKIALSADVKRAFLQISVRPEDRDLHRFFLDGPDGELRHMRFC